MTVTALMIGSAVFAVAAAYLLGSIPTGYLIALCLKGVDIRAVGEHYTGAKNVFREVGVMAGIATAGGDVAKGVVAMLLAKALPVPEAVLVFVSLAVVSGHIWPVFLQFRGGAGLATAVGVVIVALPREFLILLIPLTVAALLLWRRLDLGVICGLFAVPLFILSWWLGEPPQLILIILVLGVLVSFRVYGRQMSQVSRRALR